jgi:hypothetical protein
MHMLKRLKKKKSKYIMIIMAWSSILDFQAIKKGMLKTHPEY